MGVISHPIEGGVMSRILARLRRRVCPECPPPFARLSWAQEGEDLILLELMQRHGPVSRFFVDVGAHHPIRFSNTWLFYQQGWRGLNIDPLPGSMREFDRLRPRDVNLELAISATPGPAELYLFDETAVSTLSRETADARIRDTPYRIQRTIEVSTRTLESVLDEHVPHGVTVDFMTIDVEGHELSVITSLDWSRWRPTFLLIESLDELTLTANQIACFVDQIGYHAVARTPRTMIYRDDSSRP